MVFPGFVTALQPPLRACSRMRTAGLIFFMFVVFAETTAAQEPLRTESGRLADWMYKDAGAWVRSVNAGQLGFVAGSTAFLAIVSTGDESFSQAATHWGGGNVGKALDFANELGGPYGLLIPVSIFGVSMVTHNTRFQDAAFTSLQSYVYSNTIVMVTKIAVGRSRPTAGVGSHDFHPFTGGRSFPSGHTSSVFAMVMPWVFYYPGPVTYSLVGIAALTAMARLQRQKHWFTDVFAGAAISTSMSYYLYSRHEDLQFPAPEASLGPGMLSLRFSVAL